METINRISAKAFALSFATVWLSLPTKGLGFPRLAEWIAYISLTLFVISGAFALNTMPKRRK